MKNNFKSLSFQKCLQLLDATEWQIGFHLIIIYTKLEKCNSIAKIAMHQIQKYKFE